MRLQLTRAARTLGLSALSLWALCLYFAPATARADAASGDWSGTLEGRGNYYWEESTRVVVPEVEAELESPDGLRFGVGYLVDVISSASIAQGASDDAVFTELRHGVRGQVGKEFEVAQEPLDLHASVTYSTEDDYKSLIGSVGASLSLDERNLKLGLDVGGVTDDIRANNDAMFRGELDGVNVGASLERVLGPTLVLTLTYQFAYLEGFLGNPYRRVLHETGAPPREAPPETRYRHNGVLGLKWLIRESDTALQLRYRAYVDSWDIGALTPEFRVYQHFGESFLLRGEYRFYAQTAASFAVRPGAVYPGSALTYTGPTTTDPKLSEFRTHTITLACDWRLDFLAETFLDFARNAWIDLQVSRWLSTSSFGNGVIATAGGRLPF